MEGFVAVVQTEQTCDRSLTSMVEEGLRVISSGDTRVETAVDAGFAVGVVQRVRASDLGFGRAAGILLIVHGCAQPLINLTPASSAYQLAPDKVVPVTLLGSDRDATGLTGSFQIVAYDAHERRLAVFVDRLASRPIFYYLDRSHLILASDIQAILGISGVDCSVDIEGLAQFVRLQSILGDRTLYRRIRTLLPGTVVRVTPRKPELEIRRYWTMEPLDPFEDEQEAIRGLADAFLGAGKRMVQGSQRDGILLSGGMDSRMTLAVLRPLTEAIEAYTFGPTMTDEASVARRLALSTGCRWRFVQQTAADYWADLDSLLQALQARYSIAHTHTHRCVRLMADAGIDTVFDGWGLDLPFGGTYLPKEHISIARRQLYTFRLAHLSSTFDAIQTLLCSLDIQQRQFAHSFLSSRLEDAWNSAAIDAINQAVDTVGEAWADPYDQIEKALSSQLSTFRSFPVTSIGRLFMRQRNLLFDSAVIDSYLRLPLRQRFLGPTYRRAVESIDPKLARIVYANTGTSPFAPAVVQGLALQFRQFCRANLGRLSRALTSLGLPALKDRRYGSYATAVELARVLAQSQIGAAAATRTALTEGLLAQSGIVDVPRLKNRLAEGTFTDGNEALTLLALASLAAWLERYPGRIHL